MGLDRSYLRIRDRFFILKESPKIYTAEPSESRPITEKLLRAIWYEREYEKRNLKTTDGEKVVVVSPGEWNTDAGPDFKNAEFYIDDRRYVADVEIHRFSGDWKKHGHHKDRNFDGVRLHVFFANDKKDGGDRFQLCLADYLRAGVQLDLDDYPYQSFAGLGACGKGVTPAKFGLIEKLLEIAGDARLILKAERLSKELEQEIYGGFLVGLGYKENKEPMKSLSEIVSFGAIKKIVDSAAPVEAVSVIQAVLFGAAGFLEADSRGDDETEKLLNSYKLIFEKYSGFVKGRLNYSVWRYFRVRPPNYPQRRLYGAGFILASAAKIGFVNLAVSWIKTIGAIKKQSEHKRSVAEALDELLYVEPKGYFASRAKFGPKWSSRPAALIGRARALSITVNTILPAIYRWSRENDPPLQEILGGFYGGLQSLEPNKSTKKMANYLLGGYAGKNFKIKKEKQSQGLMQIFQDFCADKPQECVSCRLPEILNYSQDELA